MDSLDRKSHWENIYKTKELKEVSWYQPTPEISLNFIKEFEIPVTAKIIDVGGGDSLFADHLLDLGYQDITVLDISEAAIKRAKERLGERAEKVKWIVADAASFQPKEQYEFWHDRAAFHFLTEQGEINNYLKAVKSGLAPGGVFVIGTFSEQGPKKCSGIEIKQYSEASMSNLFGNYLHKIKCISIDHSTPFNAIQSFLFCSFRNMKA